MTSVINANSTGIVQTGSSTAALNIQTGGTTAISVSTGQVVTITNPTVFPAGSASAPSVTASGDTDTGLYFPTANETAITAGGTVSAAFNSNGLFFRNRIINGDMRIAQRGAGPFTGPGSDFPADRTFVANTTDGAYSTIQDTVAPGGFVNSIKVTTTTADTSLTTTQVLQVTQAIEGTNISDLEWGTASARSVTLSFWVRSSLTGTFAGSLRNSGNARSYVFNYSISAANTWEYKTVTIPGDTSGTWLTTTGLGINLTFSLGAGPDRTGTAGSWSGSNLISSSGAVSVVGTLNATWFLTGLQLETGSVATPFERRPFGEMLILCQRYFYKSYEIGTAPGTVTTDGEIRYQAAGTGGESGPSVFYPATMRAIPTLKFYSPATGTVDRARNYSTAADVTMTGTNTNGSRGFSGSNYGAIAANIVGYQFTASIEL